MLDSFSTATSFAFVFPEELFSCSVFRVLQRETMTVTLVLYTMGLDLSVEMVHCSAAFFRNGGGVITAN